MTKRVSFDTLKGHFYSVNSDSSILIEKLVESKKYKRGVNTARIGLDWQKKVKRKVNMSIQRVNMSRIVGNGV